MIYSTLPNEIPCQPHHIFGVEECFVCGGRGESGIAERRPIFEALTRIAGCAVMNKAESPTADR